jgi:hypothetical protein
VDDGRRGSRARRLIISLAAVAATFSPSLSFAQRFDSAGVRAQGMAGAFVSVADDSSATWWNPAGLATQQKVVDLGLEVAEKGDRAAALTFPSLGVSYYRLTINQLQPFGPTGSTGSVREDSGVVSQFGATFGQSITQSIVVATTVKLVNAQGDTQADLDVGVMGSFGPVRVGLAVRDVRNPMYGSGRDAIELGRRARAGASMTGSRHGALDRLVVAVDADLNSAAAGGPGNNVEQDVTAGVETWWLGERLGLRGGAGTNVAAGGGSFGALGISVMPYPRLNIEGAVTKGSDFARDRWTLGLRVTF